MESIFDKLQAAFNALTPEEREYIERNGRHGYCDELVVCVMTKKEYAQLLTNWTPEARAKRQTGEPMQLRVSKPMYSADC